ncbi:unnamed protein product [Ixodes hexagonus]
MSPSSSRIVEPHPSLPLHQRITTFWCVSYHYISARQLPLYFACRPIPFFRPFNSFSGHKKSPCGFSRRSCSRARSVFFRAVYKLLRFFAVFQHLCSFSSFRTVNKPLMFFTVFQCS